MLQEFIEKVMQVFDPPVKKSSRAAHAKTTPKERRKKPRAAATDRRKSKLRIQDWNERDKTRRKSTNFLWEGYVPK